MRIRGNAAQIYDKYVGLARDATASGDRVLAESLMQHAEHYFRIMNADNEAAAERRRRQGDDDAETDAQPGGPRAANQDGDTDGTAQDEGGEDGRAEDARGNDAQADAGDGEEESAPPRRRRMGAGRRRRRPSDGDGDTAGDDAGDTEKQPEVAAAGD